MTAAPAAPSRVAGSPGEAGLRGGLCPPQGAEGCSGHRCPAAGITPPAPGGSSAPPSRRAEGCGDGAGALRRLMAGPARGRARAAGDGRAGSGVGGWGTRWRPGRAGQCAMSGAEAAPRPPQAAGGGTSVSQRRFRAPASGTNDCDLCGGGGGGAGRGLRPQHGRGTRSTQPPAVRAPLRAAAAPPGAVSAAPGGDIRPPPPRGGSVLGLRWSPARHRCGMLLVRGPAARLSPRCGGPARCPARCPVALAPLCPAAVGWQLGQSSLGGGEGGGGG